jgi:hypothetical protein
LILVKVKLAQRGFTLKNLNPVQKQILDKYDELKSLRKTRDFYHNIPTKWYQFVFAPIACAIFLLGGLLPTLLAVVIVFMIVIGFKMKMNNTRHSLDVVVNGPGGKISLHGLRERGILTEADIEEIEFVANPKTANGEVLQKLY